MTPEEKKLLLQDLCARLPYGVMVHENLTYSDGYKIVNNTQDTVLDTTVLDWLMAGASEVKPYLRPMNTMTEEDLISYANYDFANDDIYKIVDYRCTGKGFINIYCSLIRNPEHRPVIFQKTRTSPLENWRGIDWLTAYHFDYRGLIPMGLALKALEGMYKNI